MAEAAVDVVVMLGDEDVMAGRLWGHRRRGAESATFAYAPGYLRRADAYELDPSLPLLGGPLQTPAGRAMFGAFSDCAPDRWGRRLIGRAERERARRGGAAQRSFGERDYLIGVRDDLRQGALRFRDPVSGAYLAVEPDGVPPLVELPKLLNAAVRLDRDEAEEEDLRLLLRGGSSLGGARPKAHVLSEGGRIAIAKFPSPAHDEWDVMRWEAVALGLARLAGVHVPDWTLHLIDRKAVLIVDRFDRAGTRRIGYSSAMTMLEVADGDPGSYLDIGAVIERHSTQAREDLRELWRRVAVSILISNTDDHLRNHGFLRTTSAGWTLSPAFDLNPDPGPGAKRFSTSIDFHDCTTSVDMLLDVAGHFRLDGVEARRVLADVSNAIGRWQTVAQQVGLARAAVEQMRPAFEHDQARRTREIVLR